jgi:cell division protein FtsI/penicillin-binding protein 2
LRWATNQGVQDSLGFGSDESPVESALARAAIGQEGVRLTVADVAGLTDSVATGVKRPLTMVAGMCVGRDFEPWENTGQPIDEDLRLDVVREGMSGAVQPYGTAPQLSGLADYAKTGTAELGEGRVASWVTAVGGQHIVTVRVMSGDGPEFSDPSDVPGQSASDIAVRVFEMLGQPGVISADENPCEVN